MITLELETGQSITLTGKLEKDYLKTVRHELMHTWINTVFNVKTKTRYGILFNETGEIVGSRGAARSIYPSYKPLHFFKYLLLELFHLIYEFLFALFLDLREFHSLKDWALIFCLNSSYLIPKIR